MRLDDYTLASMENRTASAISSRTPGSQEVGSMSSTMYHQVQQGLQNTTVYGVSLTETVEDPYTNVTLCSLLPTTNTSNAGNGERRVVDSLRLLLSTGSTPPSVSPTFVSVYWYTSHSAIWDPINAVFNARLTSPPISSALNYPLLDCTWEFGDQEYISSGYDTFFIYNLVPPMDTAFWSGVVANPSAYALTSYAWKGAMLATYHDNPGLHATRTMPLFSNASNLA